MDKPRREGGCLITDKSQAWKYLTGIKLSALQPDVTAEDFYEDPVTQEGVGTGESELYTVSSVMACSLCDCQFDSRHQQKSHYRLDWHRFNLKQRMIGLKSVSEDAFAHLADDVSSISGSDDTSSPSEDELDLSPSSAHHGNQTLQSAIRRKKQNSLRKYDSDDDDDNDDQKKQKKNGRCHPRIYFENDEGQIVSLYRCIVHGKKETPTSHSELISKTLGLLTNQKWALMMTGGGHFAAAVYDGSEVIVHKTFHRYTVRAKRGTVQSVRDAQGNAPKSAGASIRRHNEAALLNEVQELLTSWRPHLASCSRIFLRVPTYNRSMFFGGKNPSFDKSDTRMVTIPFPTRRATFKELQRVWETLATVECHGGVGQVEKLLLTRKQKTEWKKERKPQKEQEGPVKAGATAVEAILNQLEKQSLEDNPQEKKSRNISNDEIKETDDQEKAEEEVDVDLVEEEVISSTSHLKEYENTAKKPRKRKKKKPAPSKTARDSEEEGLTNELFTICRTGDLDQLDRVVEKLRLKYSSLPSGHSNSKTESLERIPTQDDIQNKPDLVQDENVDSEPTLSKDSVAGAAHSGVEDAYSEQTSPILPSPEKSNSVANLSNDPDVTISADKTNPSQVVCSSEVNISSETPKCNNSAIKTPKNLCDNKNTLSEENKNTGFENDSVTSKDDEDSPSCACDNETSHLEVNAGGSNGLESVAQKNQDMCATAKEGVVENVEPSRPGKKFFKFLNKPLDDLGYTFLHVAAEDGSRAVIYRLMECGADPGVKNKKGKPPFGCSLDKKTRDEFKRFRAEFPDRYDYERSQIPAPLTEEQEREKAAKQTEKKRNARKAKRAREKEQKEVMEEKRKEEEKKKKEEEKKEWYASLSDREKRALAAEKRFTQQTTSHAELQRCWSCGSSLGGKVPFSYMEFKFCSMPCLKQHKQQQQTR